MYHPEGYHRPAEAARPPTPPPPRKRAGASQGLCFVSATIFFMIFEYIGYVSVLLIPFLYPIRWWSIVLGVLFHILMALLATSFYRCMQTDPGSVPLNWGFYMGDEAKRRRYCKVCNVWKPDRTHHCSTCGRCVLNMDHHCPWLNNCVGFYNRKFFIQFLIYSIFSLSLLTIHGCWFLVRESIVLWPSLANPDPYDTLGVIGYCVVLVMLFFAITLLFGLFPFTRFHWGLISKNSTTIESMDIQLRDRSRYDLGIRRNLEQVFGSTMWLWWWPSHGGTTRPVGDGVRWRQHYLNAVEDQV